LWFHTLGPSDWFGRNDAVDRLLERRFARWLTALGNRPASDFLTDPRTARAAVLLFDQCPRNLLRDSPQAFAFDPLARAICKGALAKGWDEGLSRPERQFLYMPLMHSEHVADQLLSLRLFTELGNAFILGFARDHATMIRRFGRFPHRNAVLGRKSTPAEVRAVAAGHAW
jgi:uncharacterized protein (DUF924 family)